MCPVPGHDGTGFLLLEPRVAQPLQGLLSRDVMVEHQEACRLIGDPFQRWAWVTEIDDDDATAGQIRRGRIAMLDRDELGRGKTFPDGPCRTEPIGAFR